MSDEPRLTGSKVTPTDSNNNLRFQSLDIIEIDLAEKANTIWDGRRVILLFMIIFLAIGYFHTEFGPTEYTSVSSLIQESEGASVGDFGSSFLSSITGINIPSGGSGNMSAVATGRAPLPVTLYPKIVSSTEFQKELIYTEFEFSTLDSTLTLYDYFHNNREPALRDKVYTLVSNMTIFLPLTVYKWIKGFLNSSRRAISSLWQDDQRIETSRVAETETFVDERLQSVTEEEQPVIDWLRLRINMASSDGVLEVSTNLPDPRAAALVNAKLVDYIQEYIKEYRIQKAKQNLEAVLERYEVAKERYDEARYEQAEFKDENLNLATNAARIEESRLENETSLRFNIYNSIAQEVEQARMVLQQQIPVFNPLEKPNIPTEPSTGSSPLILVFSGLLGFFSGVGWILIRSSSIFK